MQPARSAALDHYCTYLPNAVQRWGVVFDGRFHRSIVDGLGPRLRDPVLLDVRATDPQTIADFHRAHVHDDRFGVLGFLVNEPAFDHGYTREQQDALSLFNRWGRHRMKVCFEVTDHNFDVLFADDPHTSRSRCLEMGACLGEQRCLSYARPGSALDIDIDGVTWVTQSGFEDHDYILPTGEVATCPRSVDGVVSPDGWFIGTLPLGAKYGRVSSGDVELRIARARIASVSGRNTRLCADLEAILAKVPSLVHVSEVGIGLSSAIADAATTHVAGHLWLERHLGVHLGFGARLPETDHPHLASTGHHLDLVFAHGTLRDAAGGPIVTW